MLFKQSLFLTALVLTFAQAHASPPEVSGKFSYKKAVRVGSTVTLFHPYLDLGDGQTAEIYAGSSSDSVSGTTVCKAYGFHDGDIGQSEVAQGVELVSLHADGTVADINVGACLSGNCDYAVTTATCH